VDRVEHLSALHQLLWNAEPCPGPPRADEVEDSWNARYRLMALALIDLDGAPRIDAAASTQITAWCTAPWAARVAVDSLRFDG
jgi:hypothetical protein